MTGKSLSQFEGMTIGQLRKMTEDFEKMEKELQYLKTKYPKAKEELESDNFDINEFLKEC